MRTQYENAGEGILQGSFERREMVKGREAFSHKCSSITGIKTCNPNRLDHSCQVDNIALASTTLSLKDGRYPQSIAFKIQQANWELSIIPLDHHYSKLQSTFQAS